MPNWSYNTIAFRGSKNAIVDFINKGLSKPNRMSRDAEVSDIYSKLQSMCGRNCKHHLSLTSWRKMPRTFQEYDTTNSLPSDASDEYREKYNKAREYQMKKYGVIGWYDWGCKYLGTKWDADFDSWDVERCPDGNVLVIGKCDTAWTVPIAWLKHIKKTNPEIEIGVRASEESGEYDGAWLMTCHDGGFGFEPIACIEGFGGDDMMSAYEKASDIVQKQYDDEIDRKLAAGEISKDDADGMRNSFDEDEHYDEICAAADEITSHYDEGFLVAMRNLG